MMTQNDILAELRNGSDPEKMANEFAAMLNAAMAEQKREEAAKKAEAVEKERHSRMKQADMESWAAETQAMLTAYYPAFAKAFEHLDTAKWIELFDSLEPEIQQLNDAFAELDKLFEKPAAKQPNIAANDWKVHRIPKSRSVEMSMDVSEKAINDFLKTFGLK